MDNDFNLVMSEVACIIDQSDAEYRSKIPKKFLEFVKSHADASYQPQFDVNVEIKDLNIRKGTKGVLAFIYRQYICDDEQRLAFDKMLRENDNKKEEELKAKYNVDNMFGEKKQEPTNDKKIEEISEIDSTKLNMIEYKEESIFKKIFNFIKNIFRRKE